MQTHAILQSCSSSFLNLVRFLSAEDPGIYYRCEDDNCPVSFAREYEIMSRFPAVKQGLILEWEAENSTYLIALKVRKPLVVSIWQKGEKLILYNSAYNLTIPKPCLKAVSSLHFLADRFVFWGKWTGLSERRIQDISSGTDVAC